MLNFSIKTHKNPLHQRFQMAKFFTNCYSELVKKKKNHFIFPNGSFFYFSFLSLFHFSLLSSVVHHLYSSPIFARRRRSLPLHCQSVLVVVNLCLFVTDLSPIRLLISVVDCGLLISVEVDCGPFSLLFLGWFRL